MTFVQTFPHHYQLYRSLYTCGDDERFLQPVDVSRRVGSDHTADLVVLVEAGVLDDGGVLPGDPD